MVMHLGEPFLLDVFIRCGRGDAEADEEDVGLRIGQRAKAIVIFLTGGVKETEGVRVFADHDRDGVCRERDRGRAERQRGEVHGVAIRVKVRARYGDVYRRWKRKRQAKYKCRSSRR